MEIKHREWLSTKECFADKSSFRVHRRSPSLSPSHTPWACPFSRKELQNEPLPAVGLKETAKTSGWWLSLFCSELESEIFKFRHVYILRETTSGTQATYSEYIRSSSLSNHVRAAYQGAAYQVPSTNQK